MLPGGAGAPPGGTTASRQELADGVGATPDLKRGPDAVGRRFVERCEAPAHRKVRGTRHQTAAPRGAPCPLAHGALPARPAHPAPLQ